MTVTVTIGKDSDENYYAILDTNGTTYTTRFYFYNKISNTVGPRGATITITDYNVIAIVNNIGYSSVYERTTIDKNITARFFDNGRNNEIYIKFQPTSVKTKVEMNVDLINKNNTKKNLLQKSITISTNSNNTIYTFYDSNNKNYGTVTYHPDTNSYSAEGGKDETINYQNILILSNGASSYNFYNGTDKNYSIVKAMNAMAAAVIDYV